MRLSVAWLLAFGCTAGALEIPAVPKSAKTEYMSCDVYAHDKATPGQAEGEQRRSTFRGWRNTWTDGDVTFVVTKGERVAASGEKVKIETKLRRREMPEGDLVRETIDFINVVTNDDGSSTNVTHQDNLTRITGTRRELVSRRTDGDAQPDVRETVVTTQESSTQRTTETITTGPVRMKASSDEDVRILMELKSTCTFAVPAL